MKIGKPTQKRSFRRAQKSELEIQIIEIRPRNSTILCDSVAHFYIRISPTMYILCFWQEEMRKIKRRHAIRSVLPFAIVWWCFTKATRAEQNVYRLESIMLFAQNSQEMETQNPEKKHTIKHVREQDTTKPNTIIQPKPYGFLCDAERIDIHWKVVFVVFVFRALFTCFHLLAWRKWIFPTIIFMRPFVFSSSLSLFLSNLHPLSMAIKPNTYRFSSF